MKLCIVLLLVVAALADNKNFEVESGQFVVKVTGNQNVPKYDFWLTTSPENVSSVFFHQLYEAEMKNGKISKIGPTNVALPSIDWVFTQPGPPSEQECVSTFQNATVCPDCDLSFVDNTTGTVSPNCDPCVELANSTNPVCDCVSTLDEEGEEPVFNTVCNCTYSVYSNCDETVFNITNDGVDVPWTQLQFVNHLLNTTENSHLKIDILLDNYEFQSADAQYLVLEISADLGNGTVQTDNESFYRVGDSYFSTVQNATLSPSNGTVQVNLTSSGNGKLSLIYERWEDGQELTHDPSIGYVTKGDDPFGDDGSDDDKDKDNSGDFPLGLTIALSVVGAVVVIGVIGVVGFGLFTYFGKKASYEAV